MNMITFQPSEDRVLVRCLPAKEGVIDTSAHDEKAGGGMILVEGIVMAVGSGKWIDGGWWKVGEAPYIKFDGIVKTLYEGDDEINSSGIWRWYPAERQPMTVKPGQKVIFNARWNDFASGELVGTGSDGSGPLERPMPQWQWGQRDLHLITEGDIAGILT